ncbi:acetyl-CoA carboxylase, biotin carboxyl carrier protein [Clostridium zeae]|uniref:Biotin carboxyl carrier protein of acetyl-CoA carboxylase n=1 Tax=Clostridium zeae TaxID=2759022 RepID=A0ABQ1E8M5_9CLOT|nr:biotin/lipoyl-containing protein [Clostridium zeae]GFZ30858.1 acetyl-CoA carboxylase, biotin carboxyl carrier protein [Clostridium zeae]
MDIGDIKELLNFIEKSSFSKVELNIKGDSIKLEKIDNQEISVDSISSFRDGEYKGCKESYCINENSKIEEIKAPMVGVFHNSVNPEEEPFLSVGAKIKKGDVIGIIEAMKLMNEIESQYEGEVFEICKKENEVVGYGDVLVKIKIS